MSRRRDNKTGSEQYAEFVTRALRSYGKKVWEGQLDTASLEQLAELQKMLDEQTREVVHGLRTLGYSWQQIGDALGMTKGAAYKKFGESPEGSPRKPGGQPAELR